MNKSCEQCGSSFHDPKHKNRTYCSRQCYLDGKALPAGHRSARLTLVRFSHYDAAHDRFSIFRCECGIEKAIKEGHVKSGLIKSCGCLHIELITTNAIRHGASPGKGSRGMTPEYRAFMNAKTRCRYPSHNSYKNYGGRGIEFRFETFEEWLEALGERPSPKHEVDRIDNDGHYEKGNVRWATRSEQSLNQRRSKKRPP